MAATDFQLPRFPLGISELPVKNTSGSAMNLGSQGQGLLVKLDTSNPLSATQPRICVVLTAAVTDIPLGVTIPDIPVAGQGNIQLEGLVWCTAAAAITIGVLVGPSGSTSGDVIAYTSTDPYIGQALTAAVNAGDPILVRLMPRGAA